MSPSIRRGGPATQGRRSAKTRAARSTNAAVQGRLLAVGLPGEPLIMESRRRAGPRPPPSRPRSLVITRCWSYWNTLKLGEAVLTRKNTGLDVPAEIPGPRLAARMGTHQPDRRIPVARCRPTRAEYSRGSHHRAEWSPGRARRMAVRCPTPHQSRARSPRADPGNPPPPRHHRGCPRDRQRPTTAAQEALVDDPRRPRPLRSRDAAQRSDQGRAAHHVPRATSMYATRA